MYLSIFVSPSWQPPYSPARRRPRAAPIGVASDMPIYIYISLIRTMASMADKRVVEYAKYG